VEDKVFGRRYRATEKIGSGGMAEVFKAVDEVLGRTVAVKVMHPRYAADPSYAARFRQEAQAAANLQSPYIVNIYDWGQEGDTYYIVMEYVRGTDLKSIILAKGALDSRRVAEMGAQVCSALSVAHGYDVIHRDIKPHNIMVTPDGAAKVMDFGIARAGNSTMTQTGSVLGTAHYVSPEQAQGKVLTPASDLYSLGVVLFEAATGRLPFDADSPVAVALKQVNEAPPLPRQANPGIDPGLEAVIVTAMAKDPRTRYDTADEMRRDLLRVVQGRDVATTPAVAVAHPGESPTQHTAVMAPVSDDSYRGDPRAPGRGGQSRKRSPWPWIAVAVLLVAAGLGIAAAMGLLGPQGTPVPDVIGMMLPEAKTTIETAGFTVGEVAETFDKDVPAGQVIDQSPVANASAEKGSAVDLTVSQGPRQVEVPDIVGLTEDEAIRTLSDAGFVPQGLPDQPSADVEAGTVMSQDPVSGGELDEGSTVKYVVSRGVETGTVPNVVGQKRSTAEKTLKDAGFKVKIKEQSSEDVAKGLVISQSPDKGFVGAKGSTVTLIVSKGPERYKVPDVIGKTEAEARAAIEKAKLVADVAYFNSEDTGKVEEQSPAGGTMVKAGTTVGILIDGMAP
jgi:serine/threonine-protein kinase